MTSGTMINRPPDTSADDTSSTPPAAPRPRSAVLWVLLVVSVFADLTASAVLDDVRVSSATGVLVLACVAALVLRARTGRKGA